MSELIVDKISPREEDLTLKGNLNVQGNLQVDKTFLSSYLNVVPNRLDIPILVLNDTSKFGFAYITDGQTYGFRGGSESPKKGIKFQTNPSLKINQLVLGDIQDKPGSITITTQDETNFPLLKDSVFINTTVFEQKNESGDTLLKTSGSNLFLGKPADSTFNTYATGSGRTIIRGNLTVLGGISSAGNTKVGIGSIYNRGNDGHSTFTHIGDVQSVTEDPMGLGNDASTPKPDSIGQLQIRAGNPGGGESALTEIGTLAAAGTFGSMAQSIYNAGWLGTSFSPLNTTSAGRDNQPNIVSRGSITIGIDSIGSTSNRFFEIISGIDDVKDFASATSLLIINDSTKQTWVDTLSASNDIYANPEDGGDEDMSTQKVLVVDTATGKFYRTGSYGGGTVDLNFTQLGDVTDASLTGKSNNIPIVNNAGDSIDLILTSSIEEVKSAVSASNFSGVGFTAESASNFSGVGFTASHAMNAVTASYITGGADNIDISLLDLSDTPNSISDANYSVVVNEAGDGFIFVKSVLSASHADSVGGTIDNATSASNFSGVGFTASYAMNVDGNIPINFTDLDDTPSGYSNADYSVKVNSAGTGLEFVKKVFSASNADTASFADSATSGGNATNAFHVPNDAFIGGNLDVDGTISMGSDGVTLTDTTITQATQFDIGGVLKVGTSSAPPYNLNHEITGNLILTGSTGITVDVGTEPGFIGTASHAQSSSHASFASQSISASNFSGIGFTAESASNFAGTASHAVTASFATVAASVLAGGLQESTASHAQSASHATRASESISASIASTATTAISASNFAGTASHAVTASFATIAASVLAGGLQETTASHAQSSSHASFASESISASIASTATTAISASNFSGVGFTAESASNFAGTASHAVTASFATLALTASHALNSGGGGEGVGFPFSGSAVITGSLTLSGSGNITSLGEISASSGFKGDLTGTASHAESASNTIHAHTASHVINGGSSDFLNLTDTPSDYTDDGLKLVRVNAAGDGLEFIATASHTFYASESINASIAESSSHAEHAWTASHALNIGSFVTLDDVEDDTLDGKANHIAIVNNGGTKLELIATSSIQGVSSAVSASNFAGTASHAVTASYATVAASLLTDGVQATTASHAESSSHATYSSESISASFAETAASVTGDVANAISASNFAGTASHAINALLAVSGGTADQEFYIEGDAFVSGNLYASGAIGVAGSVTIADITISHSSAAFIFGSGSTNTVQHQMTGNLALSSSIGITANMPAETVGFIGTASFAQTALNTISTTSASYASGSTSASYASSSTSASYALVAQSLLTDGVQATTASHAESSSHATYSSESISASIADSASNAIFAHTASHVINSPNGTFTSLTDTPSEFTNSGSTVVQVNADGDGLEFVNKVFSASNSDSASHAYWAVSASHVIGGGGTQVGLFTDLEDTPASLVANQILITVNGGTELEFTETAPSASNAVNTQFSENTITASIVTGTYGDTGVQVHVHNIHTDKLTSTNNINGYDITASNNLKGNFVYGSTINAVNDDDGDGNITAQGDIKANGKISASGHLFGNITEDSTATFKAVVVDTTTGRLYRTGSFGGGGEGFPFTGSAGILGSLDVNGSITGSIISSSQISGSFYGTASHAESSSYATFASSSIASGLAVSASNFAGTASHAVSSSHASFASESISASYASSSTSASYASVADSVSSDFTVQSASYASASTSASYASNSTSASYASNSTSASYASNSTSASYASVATSASYASASTSASYASVADSVSSDFIVQSASYASASTSASYASVADSVSSDFTVQSASYASSSTSASYTSVATSASYASASTSASYASVATSASYALTASYLVGTVEGTASHAESSSHATYASESISSSVATLAISGGSSNNEFHIVKDLGVHGDVNVSGSVAVGAGLTIANVVVSHSANAFQFGSSSNNTITHQMTGNLALSASVGITANMPAGVAGFIGTASHAFLSAHSEFSDDATSASYASGSTSASHAEHAMTASYALNSNEGVGFPYSGSDVLVDTNPAGTQAVITGSLLLSGSGHITASGGISASSNIIGNKIIANHNTILAHVNENTPIVQNGVYLGVETISFGNISTPKPTLITGTRIMLGADVTASGNISASGTIFVSNAQFGGSTVYIDGPGGHITASGDISASGLATVGNLNIPNDTGEGGNHAIIFGNSNYASGGLIYSDDNSLYLNYDDNNYIRLNSTLSTGRIEFSKSLLVKGGETGGGSITASSGVSASIFSASNGTDVGFYGTASWALNSNSSSYASTASWAQFANYALNAVVDDPDAGPADSSGVPIGGTGGVTGPDKDWKILELPDLLVPGAAGGINELTSSHGIRVNGSITASHHIHLGQGSGGSASLHFVGAPFEDGAAGISFYRPDGMEGVGVPILFMHNRGDLALSTQNNIFINGGAGVDDSGATHTVISAKGFVGIGPNGYWGNSFTGEVASLPERFNVVGNISASDGGNTGTGGFLFISATLAPFPEGTNNLVHDPATGQIHYLAGDTGDDDNDWDIISPTAIQQSPVTPGSVGSFAYRSVTVMRNSLTSSICVLANDGGFVVGAEEDKILAADGGIDTVRLAPGKSPGTGNVGNAKDANFVTIGQDPNYFPSITTAPADVGPISVSTAGTSQTTVYSAQTRFAGGMFGQSFRLLSMSLSPGTKQYDVDNSRDYLIIKPSKTLGVEGSNVDGGVMTPWEDSMDIGDPKLAINFFARKNQSDLSSPLTFSKNAEINVCTSVTMSHFKQFASENPTTYLTDWPAISDLDDYKCHLTMSGLLYASTSLDTNGQFNNVVCYDKDTGRFYYTGSYGGSGTGGNSGTWNLVYSEPFDFVEGLGHNASTSPVVIGDSSWNSSGHHMNSFVSRSEFYVIQKQNLYNNPVATFAHESERSRIVLQAYGDQEDAANYINPAHPLHAQHSHRTGSFILENDVISIGGLDTLNDEHLNIVTKTANGLTRGNVGIGTTAPTEKLEIAGNISASGTIKLPNNPNGANMFDSSAGGFVANQGTILFGPSAAIGDTNKVASSIYGYDAEGTGKDLHVKATNDLFLGAHEGHIRFGLNVGAAEFVSPFRTGMILTRAKGLILQPQTGQTEPLLLNQATGAPFVESQIALDVNGKAGFQDKSYFKGGLNSMHFLIGDTYFNFAIASGFSDVRAKENIKDLESQLDVINKLKPRKFEWKEEYKEAKKSGTDIGFIAQEVKEIIPEIVIEDKTEENYLGVDYKLLTPVLVKALQEQQEMIEKLSNRIDELEKINK